MTVIRVKNVKLSKFRDFKQGHAPEGGGEVSRTKEGLLAGDENFLDEQDYRNPQWNFRECASFSNNKIKHGVSNTFLSDLYLHQKSFYLYFRVLVKSMDRN